MTTENLYKLKPKDKPKIVNLLMDCFKEDPLYCALIPDQKLREKILPELFELDLDEMFLNYGVYADTEEVNGLIVVDDETEKYNPVKYFTTEAFYSLKTDAHLVKEDWTLKTLWNFIRGKNYLNSHWTNELHQNRRIHIIYFAVHSCMHGKGIGHNIIQSVIEYADQNSLCISLETHNPKNLCLYEHFGFQLFKEMKCNFDLKQYCMIRPSVKDNILL